MTSDPQNGSTPFAIVPAYLLDVSPTALKVYLALALHADHETGVCWPSQKRLAAQVGKSTQTVRRACQELVDAGALEVEHRTSEQGDPTSNLYRLPFAIARRGGGITHDRTPPITHEGRVVSPMTPKPYSDEPDPTSTELPVMKAAKYWAELKGQPVTRAVLKHYVPLIREWMAVTGLTPSEEFMDQAHSEGIRSPAGWAFVEVDDRKQRLQALEENHESV